MQDEFAARQRAITLRLSGRPVQSICQVLGRSTFWFHKWWCRYLQAGAEGLYDLTHATHHVAQRITPELERAILSIRRRLQAHALVRARLPRFAGRDAGNKANRRAASALDSVAKRQGGPAGRRLDPELR